MPGTRKRVWHAAPPRNSGSQGLSVASLPSREKGQWGHRIRNAVGLVPDAWPHPRVNVHSVSSPCDRAPRDARRALAGRLDADRRERAGAGGRASSIVTLCERFVIVGSGEFSPDPLLCGDTAREGADRAGTRSGGGLLYTSLYTPPRARATHKKLIAASAFECVRIVLFVSVARASPHPCLPLWWVGEEFCRGRAAGGVRSPPVCRGPPTPPPRSPPPQKRHLPRSE